MQKKLKKILRSKLRKTINQKFPKYTFGKGTYEYGDLCVHDWNSGETLEIGAFCSIASGVQIFLGGEHRVDWVSTYPFNKLWESGKDIKGHPKSKGNVIIGNDVWIGTEAIVLSGVTIGDGAVVGARSVVNYDIEPYAIVAGNPAKIIRKRFSDDIISRLLKLKWWEWSDEKIEKYLPLILNTDIEHFLQTAERG